jgi:YD repeat-containing protein
MPYSNKQAFAHSVLDPSADAGGNFTITEAVDPLTVDANGYAADGFTYDNNGNLTYDAWSRLSTIAHAAGASVTGGLSWQPPARRLL